jgi:hypothetical protein
MLVQVLSFLQVQWTSLCSAVNTCRRKYVVPTALQGGRDMVLLHIGGWVDDSPSIPEHVIDCRYVAAEHRIRSPGDDMPYFHRPPYLTVTDEEHDMTDFFAELKLSNDYMLTDAEFMVLYAHQTQRFPVGPIQILTKDFDEKTLNEWFEEEEEEEEAEEEEEEEVATPEDDQKGRVDASANSVEEDHTSLIQSIRLVENETNIPRNESDESIRSTASEPICRSSLDYVK